MSAPPTAVVQTSRPDPHQDRQATNVGAPSRTERVLGFVRALINYGRQLASTLQQRNPATNPTEITRNFGTIDIAMILACITRGLLRAAALEARLASRLTCQPAAPSAHRAPSRRQPRATPPVNRGASAADPRLAPLLTPADFAARDRRRPVGAVIADICRDLGIVVSHPRWRQLTRDIIEGGGNFAILWRDTFKRVSTGVRNSLAAMHAAEPAPFPPSAVALGTGPP